MKRAPTASRRSKTSTGIPERRRWIAADESGGAGAGDLDRLQERSFSTQASPLNGTHVGLAVLPHAGREVFVLGPQVELLRDLKRLGKEHVSRAADGNDLRRAARVHAGEDRFFRAEGLHGDEAVVLHERSEEDAAAAGVVAQKLLVVDTTHEIDPILDFELASKPFQVLLFLAGPGDDRAELLRLHLGHRLHQEVQTLERVEPRDREHERLVGLGAIGSLGRRGIEHLGGDITELSKTGGHRLRLGVEFLHVPGEEVAVGAVDERPAHRFLDDALSRDLPLQRRPQIVVLAHPVVEPAHVLRMAHGVARIAKRNDAGRSDSPSPLSPTSVRNVAR